MSPGFREAAESECFRQVLGGSMAVSGVAVAFFIKYLIVGNVG